ncbi:ribonuclease R [Gluconacetobacter diazotrophicus PA1 5]|uniref:Ribonuclease R n=1 Tax=Gluconacetobacter diazotrophicus (strain ATCC 49037 / DSM 5601 / CCUG 37298 / CIP 103539 / LMG 7603 / PAl5) TaxID=272568 RepID=A9GZQ2_GLUDA|nr:ribonuclease R [Gluconacetobacter diazotrophicus]ACI51423.1 ribonuclease R [Gluconacetobacter diazotrophicus PA1 5]TWB02468.1 RNAse R [Gluconacetobacter diazotrophicus]CAP53987.1 Ribonuclease R [Gluconacetobacter diazotrophicus PA1 5]
MGGRNPSDPQPTACPSPDVPPTDPRPPAPPQPGGGLPDREALRRFVTEASGRVGKREIARAFNLGPEHKAALRAMLRELALEGTLVPAGARRFRASAAMPEAALVQVTGTDPDGDPIARPVVWDGDGPAPVVFMHPEQKGRPALAPGERVVARLKRLGPGRYEGRTLRRLTDAPGRIVGVFRPTTLYDGPGPLAPPRRHAEAGRLVPADRRAKAEWIIPAGETMGAEAEEVVVAEPLPLAGSGLKPARIVARLGPMGDARSVSLLAIHTHSIPDQFPAEALSEAERARGVSPEGREDLRDVPLITIDGEDARDFDDAVYAEPDGDGFRLIVAIADVAHYVRPGSALDREARRRGNSVYFPDRVVPMLPEALSNGWCSLRPGEDRGCLFAEIFIDAAGNKTRHRFGRGIMRSAARLTYDQAQAIVGNVEESQQETGLPDGLINTLFTAWRALSTARARRGTLDLDVPERVVRLDTSGRITAIEPRPRHDSHRLIEEFMVLANVAAAEELERRRRPCLYRIHAPPSPERAEAMRDSLSAMGFDLPPPGALRARDLGAVLARAAQGEASGPASGTPVSGTLVSETILRAQSQAEYSPDNIGHFGLALPAYAHFTSPIRRYADLLVHRALIGMGTQPADGMPAADAACLDEIGEQVSTAERRAALAERETTERYVAAWLADRVGAEFSGHVSGVTRFGAFVTLTQTGATGLVPVSTLPDDVWTHDEKTQTLRGRHGGLALRLGQPVTVRLVEATPVTGGLLFALVGANPAAASGPARRARGTRPR